MRRAEVSQTWTLRLVTALVAFAGGVLLSTGAAGAVTVKVVRSLETVQPGASPTGLPIDNPPNGTPTAHLHAARGEFESFQIVVRDDAAAALDDLEVETAGALTGPGGATIPASDITIYREGYYTVYTPSDQEGWERYNVPSDPEGFNTTWKCTEATVGPTYPLPCEYPDALIPKRDVFYGESRNAFPISVPAGQNRVAWVDVLVPPGTPIGEYSGQLVVSANGLSQVIGVDVEVFDFEVPSTPTLQGGWDLSPPRPCAARGGCSSAEEGFALDSLYARAALENRIGITHPSYDDPTGNPATAGSNAALFRRYVLPLLQGGSPQDPGGHLTPVRLPGAEIKEIFLNQFSAANAGAWRSEAEHGGFLGRVHFYCDELGKLASWKETCSDPWKVASEHWGGGLKTAFTGNISQLELIRRENLAVAGSIDTLIPLVNDMQPAGGNQRDSYDQFAGTPGNRLWLYQSCESLGCSPAGYTPPDDYSSGPAWNGWPSLGIDQPASEARAMDWQVFDYKASGQYYYDVASQLPLAWSDCSQGTHQCPYNAGGNGDGTLFYPGDPAVIGGNREVPVESIRMKRYRDGEEDYELLHYLATELGEERQAREVAGGPYAPTPETGLFKRMNESNVGETELEEARERLISLLPKSTDHAPVLAEIGDRVVGAGQTLSFVVAATDVDGDPLTISASGLPIGSTFDPSSGRFEWSPGVDAVGTHSGVRFSASDGRESDAEEITITVDGSSETCEGKAVTIAGGPEAETLVGTPGPDVISGGGGADAIAGGAGDDTICGDDGDDTIDAGPGEDQIQGGPGADRIEVSDGTFDVVSCGGGSDSATADATDEVEADCEEVDRGEGSLVPGPVPPVTALPAPPAAEAVPTPILPFPDTALGHTPKHRLEFRSLPAKVTLSFDSTAPGATFSCRLDARYYPHCSSPFVARVAAGRHYFTVTAADPAGTDPTPASWTFTVKRRARPHPKTTPSKFPNA